MGRRAEREAVEHLLAGARAGRSGAVVVRGEAGIGKTALLEHARDAATRSGFRVERAGGVESEAAFAFAGLHQLCAPLLERIGVLPEPQQVALGVAFGLRGGAAPDRFLVGLAILNLVAEVAEDGPLLCLLDDAQWLDQASAQVLAFVARRVAAEQVALVIARRDSDGDTGEGDVDTFAGLPELRLGRLSDAEARTLLAAAVRTPLDEQVRDRIIAEARGNPLALLELPRAAEPGQLAGGFERAWHRARAASGVDEEVAAELERSAGRARARGVLAAAAAFLRRSAELTPAPATRAVRALEAAHNEHEAGASEAALELLAVAAAGPLDAHACARLELLRARIAFYLTRGSDVPGMLLDAARTLAPLDAVLSRETYLDALDAAMIIGPVGHDRGVLEVAEPPGRHPARPGRREPRICCSTVW